MMKYLIEKRWLFFVGILVVTGISASYLKGLQIDSSLEVWFLKDDITLKNYKTFKNMYGSDEIIVAWIQPQPDMYDEAFVKKLDDASEKMEKHPLVQRVFSLTSSDYVGSENGELVVEDMLPRQHNNVLSVEAIPGIDELDLSMPELEEDTSESLDVDLRVEGSDTNISYENNESKFDYDPVAFEQRFTSSPLWKKLLLPESSSAVVMIIEPIATDEMDEQRPIFVKMVNDTLEGFDYKLAGGGVIYEELNRIGLRDFGIFAIVSYFVLMILLVFFLRSWQVFAVASVTIMLSNIIFMGIHSYCGYKFDSISIMIPTLILIICLADIVHVFIHYQEVEHRENSVFQTFSYIFAPCFFTTLTTAVGFMSFFGSPMAILKNFGILSAMGVSIAFVVSMIVSMIVLSFPSKPKEKKEHAFMDRLVSCIVTFNENHFRKTTFLGVVLFGLSLWGMLHLKTETYTLNFLLDSNEVKLQSEFIEKDYGYFLPIEYRIQAVGYDSIKSPEFLSKIDHLHDDLQQLDFASRPTSITDIIKKLNQVLTDNTPESFTIPKSAEAIAQELMTYEMDEDNDLLFFVDFTKTEARFTVRVPMGSSRDISRYMSVITRKIQNTFGDKAVIIPSGYGPLYVKMMEYIVTSQVESFLIALVVITIMIAFIYRSLFMMFISLIPNVMPIFFTLGFMGWAGIHLDVATVTIAAIAISIAVDDTIHFLFMFRKLKQAGSSTKEALAHTIQTSGKAMMITSLLLIFGYSVFCFAGLKSMIFFGVLIAASMFFALVCDLLLLPSILLWKDQER